MNDNVVDEAGGVDIALEEMEEKQGDDSSEDAYPDARTRLLNALVLGWSLDDVRSIVEAHPESVEIYAEAEGGGEWCSAVHMAIWAPANYEIVLYLAKRNPTALRTKDHNGRLPLHLAVIYRSPLSIVRMLVKMYPKALRKTIDDGRWRGHLPLHCAFLNDYKEEGNNDWISVERQGRPDVTLFLIRQRPAAVRARTANGHLPLHLAFVTDDGYALDEEGDMGNQAAPIEVIDALLDAWSASIYHTDHQGRLAIHLACSSTLTPPAVIRRLADAWPTSLRRRDVKEGNLPIHHAIMNDMPYDVIKFLADKSPMSVQELTDEGQLALHLLLMNHRPEGRQAESLALVRLLVSHYPSAVRRKDGEVKEEGSLPLHIAAEHDAPLTVIRFLVRAHRGALLVKDDDGRLPLHLALWHSDSPGVIRFLVDECPQSLQACIDDGRLALHVAAENMRTLEFARIVHRAWPEALRVRTDEGCTPLHLVALKSSKKAEGMSIIRYFLDQWSRSVQETTPTGELPVHLAARYGSPDAVRLLAE